MAHLPPGFYIRDGEKEILVSPNTGSSGNYFTVHLEDGDVKLKSDGINKKLWIEQGKGATSLAYKLGKLIEGCENLNEQRYC